MTRRLRPPGHQPREHAKDRVSDTGSPTPPLPFHRGDVAMTLLIPGRRKAAIGAALHQTDPDKDSGADGPRVEPGRAKVPSSILAALFLMLTAACAHAGSAEDL